MHLSPSQLYKLFSCEAAWGFKYVDKVPEKVGASLFIGHCFDIMTNQIISALNADIPVDGIETMWETIWSDSISSYTLNAEEDDLDRLYNVGIEWSHIFLRDYAPRLVGSMPQPVLDFEINGIQVKQRADFLMPSRVIDIKTASKSPSKSFDGTYAMSEYHKLQLISYAIGAIKQGYDILFVENIIAVKTKTPKLVSVILEVTPEELDYVSKQYEVAYYKTQNHNNVFLANRLNPMCSRKSCSYWNLCEEKYGGKVR